MRRALLFSAAIAFAIACGDSVTEPIPDRTVATPPIAFATTTTEDGLSISTDKDDYQPGDTVHFTGSGWQPGDVLDIVLTDDPLTHDPHTWSVNVEADGMFHDSTYVVDEGDLDVTFTLVATSRATGRSLTVQFTDGVTKISGSPLGLTFNVPWVIHTNLTCTNPRTTNNSSGTAILTPNKTTDNAGNAGATESQRLTAPSTTAEGGTFKHWIRDDNTTTTTNPLCVPGVGGGGTPTYTAVYSAADLTIDKAHSGDFTRGSNGIYTLTVGNSGDAATNGTITVTDPLPAGLILAGFAGTGWTCAAAGTAPVTVTCTRTVAIAAGDAAPGLSLTVGVGSGTASSITNTVTVAGGGEPAGNNGNNTDSDQTTVVNPAVDLAIDKAHSAGFTHGSNGVFTLTARNDGGTGTTGTVTVSDQLPAGYGYVSAVGTGWTCGTSGSPVTVTCTRTVAIAAGGSAPAITLTVSVSAAAGTEVSNTASVGGGNEPAANNGNNSDTDAVTIDAPPNAAPVAVDDPAASTNEDVSVEIDVLANDTDDGPAANLSIVNLTQPAATAGSVAVSSGDKKVTYTPAADFFGTATFTYKVSDGSLTSTTAATVTVTVNPVNDAPTFTKGADETVLEDAGAQSVPGWATNIKKGPSNESGQTLTFTLTNDNNSLFAVQPALTTAGTLTYTPADDAFGSATVTVKLKDDGGTANGGVDESTQTFQINVTAVNDGPSFTKGADQTVNEDAGALSVPGWATGISAGPNESSQTVSFIVTNDNAGLFSAAPAVASNGTLTFTSAANANGTATVTLKAKDDGGTANGGIDESADQTFVITVNAVNDAPSFTKGGDKTVNEGDPAQSFANWATSISAGPPDESAQALNFIVTNSNNALFSVQPAVSPTGTLTFTPAAGPNGTAIVTVKLHDNGGTANGGVDTSPEQTFNITVNNVAPNILTLTLPVAPLQVGTLVNLSATFSDAGTADVHTALIDWEDGTSSGVVNEGTQTVSGSHTYNTPGIYTVKLTVSDETDSDNESFLYVVVYDPNAGFVTGGGWIMSPAGAYAADPTLTGKATFGFVSKYIFQKDKTTPVLSGNTEFQFQAGNLNFSSTSYQWLVVSGTQKATYKGSGTVNGVTGYGFLLSAIDGLPDRFRIKIWQTGGAVIYDNLIGGGTDEADPTTSIAGGSIVLHVPKKTT